MNDKGRKLGDDAKLELDKTFIEKSNVKETMSDLVTKLAANRPTDPLQFMAEYFQSTFEQTNRLEKCCQIVLLTHHSRPAFKQNVATAFDILNQTKLGRNLLGINGLVFDELLELLLKGTPANGSPKLHQRLSRRHYEAITYEVFHYGVSTIAIYKDYLEMASQLFDMLDVKGRQLVDKSYSEVILGQLKSTFVQLNQGADHGDVQACFNLSPDGIYAVLSKVPHTTTGKQTLNQGQFLELSAEVYVSVVPDPKS